MLVEKTHHEYDAAPLGAVYWWHTHSNNISPLTRRLMYAATLTYTKKGSPEESGLRVT
jgi:hypothetical protein